MADGGLTIEIDPDLAERLKAAAAASGESLDDYVRHALEAFSGDAGDWAEDLRRLAEYDATGESIGVEEALAEFEANVERRLADRRRSIASSCRATRGRTFAVSKPSSTKRVRPQPVQLFERSRPLSGR